ncbi:hypothetical protein Hanom_Chr02g00173591 [Helianthus anomalus]
MWSTLQQSRISKGGHKTMLWCFSSSLSSLSSQSHVKRGADVAKPRCT